MEIKNCTISTEKVYKESEDPEDRPNYGGKYQDLLVVRIPIPGGKVVFQYKITEEETKALEKASKLSETK